MKKIIILSSLCLIMITGHAKDYANEFDREKAINIAMGFISQLKRNQVFTYEDEVKYFGVELTLYSYVILEQLGYVNELGGWIKPKPKISFICELIRMQRDTVLLEKPFGEFFIAGIPCDSLHDGSRDWLFDAQVIYIQKKEAEQGAYAGNCRMIMFYFRNSQQPGLRFPIFIDGKPLAPKLGFEYIDVSDIAKGVPRLKTNELKRLIEHIKHLPIE